MRCLIGFFGLTRSLRHTAPSIHAAFLEPLRTAGIDSVRVGHFNLPDSIDNPRSGETRVALDRHESRLLDLDMCWVEPQSEAVVATAFAIGAAHPDAYGDGYRSLRNLCHQLHSLERLWSMLRLLDPGPDDVVLLLRPDLRYLDALDPWRALAPLLDGAAELIVPGWQGWGGLNDRFAFATARAAEIYATRLRDFASGCAALGAAHSERLLACTARGHGLLVGTTAMRAVRVRANGLVPGNDARLLAEPCAA